MKCLDVVSGVCKQVLFACIDLIISHLIRSQTVTMCITQTSDMVFLNAQRQRRLNKMQCTCKTLI